MKNIVKTVIKLNSDGIALTEHSISTAMGITKDEAIAEIDLLIQKDILKIVKGNYVPLMSGGIAPTTRKLVLTSFGKKYLSYHRKELFLKWYPIIISTISLIISLCVAIYK